MKVKFIDYYNLASNLVLMTFVIGVIVLLIRGLNETVDLIVSAVILSLRYFSFILIRRRIELGKYLLVILIARNVYRLIHITNAQSIDQLVFYAIIIQIVLVVAALILTSKASQKYLNNLLKKSTTSLSKVSANQK